MKTCVNKQRKVNMKNVNLENLIYLLAVVKEVNIDENKLPTKKLPYKMEDFTRYVQNNNLTYKQIFNDFGYFLERSEDERIKHILKDLVCEHCTFYNVTKINLEDIAIKQEYHATITMPFPNDIVMHVLETVKDLKNGKKEFEHKRPYTRVSKTFDDGIEIIPEQQK